MPGGCKTEARTAHDDHVTTTRKQTMKKTCGNQRGVQEGWHKKQGAFKSLADIAAAYIRCEINAGKKLLVPILGTWYGVVRLAMISRSETT